MHAHTTRSYRLLAAFSLGALTFAVGCSTIMRVPTDLTVRSLVSDKAVVPKMTVRAYIPTDRNTVDVYLSDIPAARLSDPADTLAGVAGNIIHLHIFLMPEPGQTPIDNTACNFTVRHVVLTGVAEHRSENVAGEGVGVVGIYGGGGFCMPDSSPGDRTFSGSLSEATMRLVRVGGGAGGGGGGGGGAAGAVEAGGAAAEAVGAGGGGGFADRLGASSISGSFSAPRNDDLANAISQRVETLSRSLRDVAR